MFFTKWLTLYNESLTGSKCKGKHSQSHESLTSEVARQKHKQKQWLMTKQLGEAKSQTIKDQIGEGCALFKILCTQPIIFLPDLIILCELI